MNEVLAFIAEDSESAAAKILDAIDATTQSLATLSERGRVVPELNDPTIREVYVYRYRLMYQVSSTEIRMLAVLHGAMDFAGRLKTE